VTDDALFSDSISLIKLFGPNNSDDNRIEAEIIKAIVANVDNDDKPARDVYGSETKRFNNRRGRAQGKLTLPIYEYLVDLSELTYILVYGRPSPLYSPSKNIECHRVERSLASIISVETKKIYIRVRDSLPNAGLYALSRRL